MGKERTRQLALQVLIITSLFAASQAQAARQGSLGPSSTGMISISASVASRAQISAPKDIEFGGIGKTTTKLSQNLCLTSNSLTRSFAISAIGSGDAGALELFNGRQTIAYTVEWTSREDLLLGGRPAATGELLAAASVGECDHGPGSTALIVAMKPAHVDEARTGAPFTGTLTLLVAPQ